MTVMFGVVLLILFLLGLVVLVACLGPVVTDAMERAERRRAVVEASWRLHQQASEALSQMLQAAREQSERERSS